MTETLDRIKFYNGYLDARTGKYEWRCERYDGVIEKLQQMGLQNGDTVVDVGAGRQEFHKRLREHGWSGWYIPIDAALDGVDLNNWKPPGTADFFVAIELLEHVHDPYRLMTEMYSKARIGVAATTPNPRTTDVLGMDSTHVCEIYAEQFEYHGWRTEIRSFYGQPNDSVLAWRF